MHWWSRLEPLETVVARLARLGFDGIEIECEPALTDARSVMSILDENGIECCGGSALMGNGRDLVNSDRYLREATVRYIKDCLQYVAQLGGEVLTFAPAAMDRLSPGQHRDEWAWCVDGLRECQEFGQSLNVSIAIEPVNRFRTYFINRCEQALKMVADVGGTCGVCLDTFHMNIEESSWRDAIHLAGSKLLNVHVADNNRLPPGRGAIDWTAVARELRAVGYRGYITAELLPVVDWTPGSSAVDRNAKASRKTDSVPSHESWDDLATETINSLRTYFNSGMKHRE